MSLGLLVVRLVIGLAMAAHGAQKAFGWFGGHGLKGTGAFFESIGFRPGAAFAFLASGTEIVSGLLVAAGALGPVGPALMIMVMIIGAGAVHLKNGFFAQEGGFELNAIYAAAAAALAFGGFGRYSVDSAAGIALLFTGTIDWIAIVAAVVLGIAMLALRRPAPESIGAQAS